MLTNYYEKNDEELEDCKVEFAGNFHNSKTFIIDITNKKG